MIKSGVETVCRTKKYLMRNLKKNQYKKSEFVEQEEREEQFCGRTNVLLTTCIV